MGCHLQIAIHLRKYVLFIHTASMPSFSKLRPAFNDGIQSILCDWRDAIAKSKTSQIRENGALKIEYFQGIQKQPEVCKQTPSNWNLFLGQNINYHPKCELEKLPC